MVYLKDMSVILFAFHLARENIELLASTNGMFKFAGSDKKIGCARMLRSGGRKERRLEHLVVRPRHRHA
jgi:hypothetical protein